MPVVIALLRGVNVLGRNTIKMDALRGLCGELGHRDAQTYVNSGNVVFRTAKRSLDKTAAELEAAIEAAVGFRPDVVLRTAAEMRQAIQQDPFAGRADLNPSSYLVTFLRHLPEPEAVEKVRRLETSPEELHIVGREVYIYFPNGMGRTKLNWAAIGKMLKTSGTGRNWTTANKLLEIAESLE